MKTKLDNKSCAKCQEGYKKHWERKNCTLFKKR